MSIEGVLCSMQYGVWNVYKFFESFAEYCVEHRIII